MKTAIYKESKRQRKKEQRELAIKRGKKDELNIFAPEDLRRCREQAERLSKHGSLEGKIPVRIDARTTIYTTPERYEKIYKNQQRATW